MRDSFLLSTLPASGSTAYAFSNATSASGSLGIAVPQLAGSLWFISLTDDGTNITISSGPTPLNLSQVYTNTRSSLSITPTQIGVFLDNEGPTFLMSALIVHWAGI